MGENQGKAPRFSYGIFEQNTLKNSLLFLEAIHRHITEMEKQCADGEPPAMESIDDVGPYSYLLTEQDKISLTQIKAYVEGLNDTVEDVEIVSTPCKTGPKRTPASGVKRPSDDEPPVPLSSRAKQCHSW